MLCMVRKLMLVMLINWRNCIKLLIFWRLISTRIILSSILVRISNLWIISNLSSFVFITICFSRKLRNIILIWKWLCLHLRKIICSLIRSVRILLTLCSFNTVIVKDRMLILQLILSYKIISVGMIWDLVSISHSLD